MQLSKKLRNQEMKNLIWICFAIGILLSNSAMAETSVYEYVVMQKEKKIGAVRLEVAEEKDRTVLRWYLAVEVQAPSFTGLETIADSDRIESVFIDGRLVESKIFEKDKYGGLEKVVERTMEYEDGLTTLTIEKKTRREKPNFFDQAIRDTRPPKRTDTQNPFRFASRRKEGRGDFDIVQR